MGTFSGRARFQAFPWRGTQADGGSDFRAAWAAVDEFSAATIGGSTMIFTSYTYVLFLAIVFCLHWLMPQSWRKAFLILASYVFYCSWKWEFGFLLLGVTLFNWAYGKYVLARMERMSALLAGIAVNLAPLIY